MKSTQARSSEGARIVGGNTDRSGPGPEVMAADTLQGDKVVNDSNEDLGTIAWASQVHDFYGVSPYWSDAGSMAMETPASRRTP